MSRKNDELAQFIGTLSASERRYFRMASDTDRDQNYLKLYDLLASPDPIDAKAMAKQLGPKVNLSYERIYLQKMLLRSLRNYHEDSSTEAALYTGLVDIDILFSKGQYNVCLRAVKKHLDTAIENELFSIELQLYQWYRWILIRLNKYSSLTGEGRELYHKEIHCIDQSRNLAVLKELKTQFVECMFSVNAGGRENMVRLKKIISHPLLKNERQAQSFKGKVLYYEIVCWYYQEAFELKRAYELYSSAFGMFEQSPDRIIQMPQIYSTFLSNFIIVCHYMRRYDTALATVDKMENITSLVGKGASKNFAGRLQQLAMQRRIEIYLYDHRFKDGIALFERYVRQTSKDATASLSMIYTGALCYLYHGMPEAALKWLRKIIDGPHAGADKDMLLMTHIAHIMAHYELGNFTIIPHLLVSLRRFARTVKFRHATIPVFIKLITKLIAAQTAREKKQVLNTYTAEFENMKNLDDQRLLRDLDIAFWLDRNITN